MVLSSSHTHQGFPRLVVKLLKMMEKQDPTLGCSGSFFLVAPSPPSSQTVGERGLLPHLSPTPCGEQLLHEVHGLQQLMAASRPFSSPSPCSFLLECVRECRERGSEEQEREWESESERAVLLVLWFGCPRTGQVACLVGPHELHK
jgi:hypothetical protein